ncbi:MAG TPA: ABC transporter substrate-binding protein [Stellaceae bacterium]|nr:ABC transporter substrate-binding protein [Stellaceae bacterium]
MTKFTAKAGWWLGAAALAGIVPVQQAAAQDAATVKLGVVTFLSGAAAGPFGIPSRNAAELVVEAINAGTLPAPYNSKGFAGAKLEPIIIDENGSTTEVVQNYRDLVQRRGATAVVGYVSSGSCLGVAPVAEELKTLTVFFDCGTPRIFEDEDHHYVFRASATSTIDSTSAARYMVSRYKDMKAFTGINQNYAWGQDSWSDFEGAIKDLKPGLKEEDPLFPKLFAGQYSAEITTLLAKDADVVHSSFWGGDLESFVLQADPRGLFQKERFYISTAETAMFRLGPKLADGIIMGARGPWGVYSHDTELNRWFRHAYTDRFGTPPVYPSYQMALSLLGTKLAYDKAAAANPKPGVEDVVRAFTGLEFEVFGTKIAMAQGKGHQGIHEIAQGTYKYDKATTTPTITDIVYYPAECVSPPEGTKSTDWIKDGMKGAKNCP